jgi:hypothetical protein
VYKFRELVGKRSTFTVAEFTEFEEALETLFVWSHKLHDHAQGLIGNRSNPPNNRGYVPLAFSSWQRLTGFLDATQYGPSLKAGIGLGFLDAAEGGYYRLTSTGETLAQAFDQVLRRAHVDTKLGRLGFAGVTRRFAHEIYRVWVRDKATAGEIAPFLPALYDPSKAGEPTAAGRRAATVNLLLHVLKRLRRGGTIEELRWWLASGLTRNGVPLPFPQPIDATQRLWSVLQVRQAQRLALEALFAWVEVQLLTTRVRSTVLLAERMTQVVRERLNEATPTSLRAYAARLLVLGQARGLWAAALTEPDCDLFAGCRAVSGALGTERVASEAWRLLLLSAAYTREWAARGAPPALLALGGVLRVSLAHWADFLAKRQDDGDHVLCRQVVETYLVSQHLRVATQRAEVDKVKLRLVLEEEGLVSLIVPGKEWRPRITGDRLPQLLALLTQCKLLHYDRATLRYALL